MPFELNQELTELMQRVNDGASSSGEPLKSLCNVPGEYSKRLAEIDKHLHEQELERQVIAGQSRSTEATKLTAYIEERQKVLDDLTVSIANAKERVKEQLTAVCADRKLMLDGAKRIGDYVAATEGSLSRSNEGDPMGMSELGGTKLYIDNDLNVIGVLTEAEKEVPFKLTSADVENSDDIVKNILAQMME